MSIPTVKLTITEIEPHTFYAQFENQCDLSHCLMRLQEYYESPNLAIRGKYFTLEEFFHANTSMDGKFDYTYNWIGYNVPGQIVNEWFELFSKSPESLTNKESQFFSYFQNIITSHNKWYLIATQRESDKRIINHEIAHARYYLNVNYLDAANKLLNEIPQDEYLRMFNSLKFMGYSDPFVADEIQAYLSTSNKTEIKHKFGILSLETYKIANKFRKLFKNKR